MTNAKPTTISELYAALVGDIGDLKIGFHTVMLRFDHTDALLDVIATTVNRHEEILNKHTSILNDHSEILNQHSQQFVTVNNNLDRHEKLLERLTMKADHYEELLDTLAEQSLYQTKILDHLDPQISLHDQRLGTVERSVARLEFTK